MKPKNNFTMNIKRTGQYVLLVLAITSSLSACKKESKPEPEPEPVEVVAISVQELKNLAKDEAVTLPDGRKITGIVVSDGNSGKNIAATSLVLQEETGKPGIIVNLAAAHTFKAGDKVDVNVSKQKLEKVNGEITVMGIPVANVTSIGTGSVTAKETNTQELAANAAAWNGTLVKLPAGRFYGGDGKYVSGIEYGDATGRVKIGVAATAAFKDQTYAASVEQLVGIVRQEGAGVRLDIRNTADVTGGEITRIVVEDFSDVESNNPNSYNPALISFGFTTAVEEWGVIGGEFYFLKGNRFDGDFLSASRDYIYMPNIFPVNSRSRLRKGKGGINLKGVKTITITFAGSKMEGANILDGNAPTNPKLSVEPFNPVSDYFQVAFSGSISSRGSFYLESAKFTKTGEWFTVTFTMPTKEEIIAMGLRNTTEEQIDEYLENPEFLLLNTSTRGTTEKAPIIFDRIEFGFTD